MGEDFGANAFLSNCLVFVRREIGEGVASWLVFGIYPLQKLTRICSIHMVFIQATASAFTDSSCIIRNMHQLLMLQYIFFYVHPCIKKTVWKRLCTPERDRCVGGCSSLQFTSVRPQKKLPLTRLAFCWFIE